MASMQNQHAWFFALRGHKHYQFSLSTRLRLQTTLIQINIIAAISAPHNIPLPCICYLLACCFFPAR